MDNLNKYIGSKIRAIRESKHMTAEQLGHKLGVSRATITRYETGVRKTNQDSLFKLAEALNVSINDFFPSHNINPAKPSNIEYLYDSNTVVLRIPLLGKIAAGTPITAVENIDDYVTEIFDKDDVPKGGLFALRTNGHSMEPTIPDNSIIIFREQPSVEDGEIAAILVNHDEEATVKRVKHIKGITMLIPDNKKYDPIPLTKDNPGRVIGRAIEVRQRL